MLINAQPLFFLYIPLEDIHVGPPICHISTNAPEEHPNVGVWPRLMYIYFGGVAQAPHE